MVGLLEVPSVCIMVELILSTSGFVYGWIPRGPPVFVWLDTLMSSALRMVGFFESHWYSHGWTLGGAPVSVWMDY